MPVTRHSTMPLTMVDGHLENCGDSKDGRENMQWLNLLSKETLTGEEYTLFFNEFKRYVHDTHCRPIAHYSIHFWGCRWLTVVEGLGLAANDKQHLYKMRHLCNILSIDFNPQEEKEDAVSA